MKKVLIITYYWPPSGGPGVQRVLKFAKYLPQFGWQPIILTVKNGEYPAIDSTLEKDIPDNCIVYKTDSFEPTSLYKKFTGMKKEDKIPVAVLSDKNVTWKKKIANWIRLNLFIPDAKIGWLPFAVKTGKKIIKEHQPEVIFSSSPPQTVQLIAKELSKWSGIKWVADFRDPWTDIYHYDKSSKLKISQYLDLKKEKNVIHSADIITSVSDNVLQLLSEKIDTKKQYVTIPNGYDEDDFVDFECRPSDKFIISYGGKINNQQNPNILWKVLQKICELNPMFQKELQIQLIGNITGEVVDAIGECQLKENLVLHPYMNHDQLIIQFQSTALLLLLIPNTEKNKGILTGKLFEYLAMKKFILGFGPVDGDSANILNKTQAGIMLGFDDEEKLEKVLLEQYENWKRTIPFIVNDEEIVKYSRKNITQKLIELF